MKRTIFFVLSLFSLIFLSCNIGSKEEVLVESITLSETELTMNVGDVKEIIPTVFPENAVNKKLSYSLTVEQICLCYEENGAIYIEAISEGEAKIVVKSDNGKFAECKVKVINNDPIEGDDPTDELVIEYKVNHYKESLEGKFELYESEILKGYKYTYTEAKLKEYVGYSTEFDLELGQEIIEEGTEIDIYYLRNEYTITFNTGDGSPVDSIRAKYGATITVPENPTKKFHTFLKWNPALPETMEKDLTVEAIWVEDEKTDIGITIY